MKRFILMITMACALSGVALAGDVHSTDSPAPPPPAPPPCTIPVVNSEPICQPSPLLANPLVTAPLNILRAVII